MEIYIDIMDVTKEQFDELTATLKSISEGVSGLADRVSKLESIKQFPPKDEMDEEEKPEKKPEEEQKSVANEDTSNEEKVQLPEAPTTTPSDSAEGKVEGTDDKLSLEQKKLQKIVSKTVQTEIVKALEKVTGSRPAAADVRKSSEEITDPVWNMIEKSRKGEFVKPEDVSRHTRMLLNDRKSQYKEELNSFLRGGM